MGEVSILLGAGASRPYQIPTFPEFREASTRALLGYKNTDLSVIPTIWKGLYAPFTLEEFYTLVSFQRDVGVHIKVDTIPSLSATDRKCIQKSRFCRDGTLDLSALLQGIERIIPITVFHSANPEASRCYLEMAKVLSVIRSDKPYKFLDIISLNWDTLFEANMEEEGLYPYYPYLKNIKDRMWVNVIKPHGSLNWDYCDNPACRKKEVNRRPTQLLPRTEWKAIKCEVCKRENKLLLFPPTLSKLDYGTAKWFGNVWRQIYEALRWTKYFCVIGYSFPRTDYPLYLTLLNAMRLNNQLERIDIVNIARNGREEKMKRDYFKSVFKPAGKSSRIKFFLDGFENYDINMLSSIL